MGNDRWSASVERRMSRLCRESLTRRIMRSSPASRRFRLTLRCTAWMSSSAVSASTPVRRGKPDRNRSSARRSRLPGIGHSRWHRTDAGRRASNLASKCRCAASRTGRPPGNARTQRSNPTELNSLAACTVVNHGDSPRSTRPTSEPDRPAAAPSVSWLTPAILRALRSSAPSILFTSRPRRAPASVARSRAGMAGIVRSGGYWPVISAFDPCGGSTDGGTTEPVELLRDLTRKCG